MFVSYRAYLEMYVEDFVTFWEKKNANVLRISIRKTSFTDP